ncbi:MAG: PorT family protein [Bacteroidetes bacterium]|nr:PorT family protein [Bacteroidota bacterium]MBU1718813.1 PorT family protein [Bacteroidota bacterium]
MKKIVILFTVIMIFPLFMSAQTKKVQFGLTFSPNISWFKPDDKKVVMDAAKFGYNFGPVININFGDNFSLETGLLIYNNGGKVKYLDSITSFEGADSLYTLQPNAIYSYRSQFLELPFSVKLKTNEVGYFTYFLKFGLNPQMLLKAKGDISQFNIADEDFKKELSFFNLGYNISGGIHYSLGANTTLLAEIGFNNGFFDVTKDKTKIKDYKVIMNNLLLRVGLLF